MYPIYVLLVSTSPKFHPLTSCCWVGPCWEKFTEWPQIDLEPYKVKLPCICITSVPDSKISLRFALQPSIFETQAILIQVHWMTPKWPWALQVQIYPIYLLLVQRIPNFTPFGSTMNRFRVTDYFEKSAPRKRCLRTTDARVTTVVLLCSSKKDKTSRTSETSVHGLDNKIRRKLWTSYVALQLFPIKQMQSDRPRWLEKMFFSYVWLRAK